MTDISTTCAAAIFRGEIYYEIQTFAISTRAECQLISTLLEPLSQDTLVFFPYRSRLQPISSGYGNAVSCMVL